MCEFLVCLSLVSEQRSKGELVMAKPVTCGDKLEEVVKEVEAMKVKLEEVAGQVGSVMDSLKILPELVAQIAALRKANGPINVAELSRTKTSELGIREEVRVQERRFMGAGFQEDRHRQGEMVERFQEHRRTTEQSFPLERRCYAEQEP